jgi:uncharacterized protein (DUF58 family)
MILPDLAELLSLPASARLSTLLTARNAQGPLHGGHQSPHRGRGLEFQEVRPYVPGDDVRVIDWRVTARRGRPHTKLFREERERPVWLVADLDPGMFFGSQRQTKSAVVVRACAVLAWVASQAGDRVGAVIAGSAECRIQPPRAQQRGVVELLGALVEMQPRSPGGEPRPRNLSAALRSLAYLVRPGSAILALSDFAGLDTESESIWSSLASHSESRLIWITDPLEEQGLPSGRYRVGLPHRSTVLDGDRMRPSWQHAWHEREARINRLAQRLGTPLIQLKTSEPVADALRASLKTWRLAA